jgi:hypothetical protein
MSRGAPAATFASRAKRVVARGEECLEREIKIVIDDNFDSSLTKGLGWQMTRGP